MNPHFSNLSKQNLELTKLQFSLLTFLSVIRFKNKIVWAFLLQTYLEFFKI